MILFLQFFVKTWDTVYRLQIQMTESDQLRTIASSIKPREEVNQITMNTINNLKMYV